VAGPVRVNRVIRIRQRRVRVGTEVVTLSLATASKLVSQLAGV